MNLDVTPYQLATLAARIAPQLCGNPVQQEEAMYLALSLFQVSVDLLDGQIRLDKELQEYSVRRREF